MTMENNTRTGKNSARRLSEVIIYASGSLVILLSLIVLLQYRYGIDQGIYTAVSRVIADGGVPYRDVWDFKTPGIFFVYSLARSLFGDGIFPVRLFECLSMLSLVAAFMIFSRRHALSLLPGFIGSVFAILIHVQLGYWDTGQPESFGGVLLAWAIVAARFDNDTSLRHYVCWAVSGFLFFCAAMMKPPLGGGFVLLIAAFFYYRLRGSGLTKEKKHILATVAVFSAGALTSLLLFFAYFGSGDALPDISYIFFEFIPGYTRLLLDKIPFHTLLYQTLVKLLLAYSWICTIGLIMLFALRKKHHPERQGIIIILSVMIPQIIGVAMQAKLFPYHFGAILPFFALLAGWGFWKCHSRWDLRLPGAVLFVMLFSIQAAKGQFPEKSTDYLAALCMGENGTAIKDRLHSTGEIDAGAYRRISEMIRRKTSPEDRIFVWGFLPMIYELSDRSPASRFIYNIPQRTKWSSEHARNILMKDLGRNRPEVIIVEHDDRVPFVMGDNMDSAEVLMKFDALRKLISTSYRYEGSTGNLDLFTLKPRASEKTNRGPLPGVTD